MTTGSPIAAPAAQPSDGARRRAGLARDGGASPLPRLDDIPRRPLYYLRSYDGLHAAHADLYFPGSVDELRVLFQMAKRTGRRITFRAGAQAFDGQALNDDIVISMRRFKSIEIDTERSRMTVGAGATWGVILRELSARGLVPYTAVSTSYATAGGTVSGGCHSRFSCTGGKEGRHVEQITLLTLDGELLRLRRDGPHSALFHAVIGGLGYLGAVIDVTYRVARVAPAGTPIRLVTRADRHTTLEGLASALIPAAERRAPDDGDLEPGWLPEALFAVTFRTIEGTRSMVFHSRYEAGTSLELRPMLTHRPRHPLRIPTEWLLRASVASRAVWTIVDRFLFDFSRPYVDDLFDYMFFMDGNVLAKRIAQTLGMPMSTVQQAFMIPYDPDAHEESLRRLVDFLQEIDEITTRDDIAPTLLDVLFIQRDDSLLSANYGTDGFAVTLAFETSDLESVKRIRLRLTELSGRALELGGRVYLVKNVHATADQLQAMYVHALPEFVRLKQRVDPGGLLRNDFLERVFPAHFRPPAALAPR